MIDMKLQVFSIEDYQLNPVNKLIYKSLYEYIVWT